MKICFSDFWSPFDPNNNFFIHLLKQSFEDVEVVHPEDAINFMHQEKNK